MASKVRVNVKGLEQIKKALRTSSTTNPHINTMFKRLTVIYKSDMQRRFVKFSRGGGTWAPLAARTLAGRRKGRKGRKGRKRSVSILRDTGALFNALSPNVTSPGGLQRRKGKWVLVGFGGTATHPNSGKAKTTIVQIARFHHEGAGRLPKRTILAQPSPPARKAMTKEVARTVGLIAKEADIRNG